MARTVWVRDGDVAGKIEDGQIVTAAHELSDWCLRTDDDGPAIPEGAVLEIIERRSWGASMAEELPALSECVDDESRESDAEAWMQAARELEALGHCTR